ncbi:peptide-methionine (S)-S-oxide reductase MsrA [[Clostridium] innocuum]|nr:peptide-methionine (S)-S-oxide reductase MsrA [[Clostridium] innocuum]
MKEIYLAGGCFWGMQAYFQQLQGVIATEVGYANGNVENPTYEMVCSGTSGYAETLHIQYDDTVLTLPFLLSVYFNGIDPTSYHRQGNDIGEQYRTGIYYVDTSDRQCIETSLQELAKHYEQPVVVEVKPLMNFYAAEEYHQEYLKKHPGGYCHISKEKIQAVKNISLE